MQLFSLGTGIGDVLLSTAIIRAWRAKHGKQLPVLTFYPEIFYHNPDILFTINTSRYQEFLKHFNKPILWRLGNRLHRIVQQQSIGPNYPFPCRGKHLLDAMAESMGLSLLPSERQPVIWLSEKEKRAQSRARGWIAVQSSSNGYWTVNKNWVPGRMQQVVNELNALGYQLVQLGTREDEALSGVKDMRGKTSLREAAAIMANVEAFIGLEGGLVHLARSVNTKSVVVYTGYTQPEETGYAKNVNLRDTEAGEGCWRRDLCEHCRKSAEEITVDMVVEAVSQITDGTTISNIPIVTS